MIDHLMTFASEAAAKADPVVGQYWQSDGKGGGGWRSDVCIPNVLVWNPANDTTTVVNGINMVTHTPIDANWRLIITSAAIIPALQAMTQCHGIFDRDAAGKGSSFVLQSVMTLTQLDALMIQPTFMGSAYPWGNAK